jgi:hypothetical protein
MYGYAKFKDTEDNKLFLSVHGNMKRYVARGCDD